MFITDAADLMSFSGEVTFVGGTELPDTQCTLFGPMDDDTLEGTHDLAVTIDSSALPPSVNAADPDSLTVTITDDEADCKIKNMLPIFNTICRVLSELSKRDLSLIKSDAQDIISQKFFVHLMCSVDTGLLYV